MDVLNSIDGYLAVWNKIKDKLINVDLWLSVIWVVIQIVLIWLISRLIVKVSWNIINRFINKKPNAKFPVDERRTKTLGILIHNILKYTIYFFAILMILDKLNFNLGPLLAGAGVVGLAIGFGAQNLVKDIITGFFIVFEDQFAVGDYISVNDYTGTVEELGLRITKIRKWTGELYIIPNGNITEVTNYSTHNSIAVIDVGVAYEEDIKHVTEVLEAILKESAIMIKEIVQPPEVLGVQDLAASDVVIRVIAETKPMEHYAVARRLRAMIKNGFDKEGIEIPYPRLVTFRRTEE